MSEKNETYDYRVAAGICIDDLENEVNSLIGKGWIPQGGFFESNDRAINKNPGNWCFQAMISSKRKVFKPKRHRYGPSDTIFFDSIGGYKFEINDCDEPTLNIYYRNGDVAMKLKDSKDQDRFMKFIEQFEEVM